ncbi:hypothetical protein PoB_000477700 [Plakobranchus ocellatus]|uniref:Uncharacterized protein n=1 Tax=Plakobranchus ocellatus TaxID=259542 RepID=A0AAV3Y652_9GAST|nr:hypothetical protein PoB_000477700 [Plakobranchus ocellatus]
MREIEQTRGSQEQKRNTGEGKEKWRAGDNDGTRIERRQNGQIEYKNTILNIANTIVKLELKEEQKLGILGVPV